MDSVRFGRALGFGARHAVKALAGAVDAAAAPNPTSVRKPATQAATPMQSADPALRSVAQSRPASVNGSLTEAARTAARVSVQAQARAQKASKGVALGSKRLGDSVWAPFKKLSGVLWLEMTGAFFGIFALFAGQAVWTHRADLHSNPANHEAHIHAFVFLAMALVFGYFCLSSFVRAYRR